MQFLLLLVLVAAARAKVVVPCTGIDVHGVNHEQEVLATGLEQPYQLALDYDSNYLFFSYSTPAYSDDPFQSGYINLKTNEFGIISQITGGFANAVDPKSHIVYLGSNNGIYKFNFDTKSAEFVGALGVNIWQLHSKDKLYYTTFPDEKAYTFENGVSKKVPELANTRAMLMTLDENNNILFVNSSGLFSYKKDQMKTVNLGDYNVNAFTNDIDRHVFFSTPSAIYAIDTNGDDITKVADLHDLYGIAVEANGSIIYADRDRIVRLKPTKGDCFISNNKL